MSFSSIKPAELALAVLGAAVLLTGCGRRPAAEPGSTRAREPREQNLLLVLVDTLRADHLGAYGYGRPTSPNLDAFAASGVLFERARSQASCTFPSANSILTSRYPAAFLGQPEGRLGIPEGVASIAEILRGRGYATLALSASPIVRKSPSRFNPHGGFDRGFGHFGERCVWRSARCLLQQVRRQVPGLPRPFFVFLHFMDPHGPYRPPGEHPRSFAGDYTGRHDFIRRGEPNPIAEMLYQRGPRWNLTPADIAHLVDLYDEEIAYFDSRLPALLRVLDGIGAAGDTLVALVSDHGEEFLEHGHIKHCRTPYETQIHTPLILRLPGGPAGVRIDEPVENVDLVPTLLDYLGADPAAFPFDGRSLRPLIEGRGGAAAGDVGHAYSSQGAWRTVADGRFKLLARLGSPRVELFDLAADPGETRDVSGEHPDQRRRLGRALFEWVRRTEGEGGLEAAEEAQRRLRALGYIE